MSVVGVPAFTSIQSADLPNSENLFDSRLDSDMLLRMLNGYFSVAEECAGGLVRMRWAAGRPRFVLRWPALTLIAMGKPNFERSSDTRAVSVAVEGGWLVDPTWTPRLAIAITREPGRLRARVELSEYRPRGGRLAAVRWVYRQTQARVHVWVGLRYLRRLAREWR